MKDTSSSPPYQDILDRFSNENGGYASLRPRQHQAGGESPSPHLVILHNATISLWLECLVCWQALVNDIYSELVEDACLGLCFEVHRAVKQGYFFLDETDQESMKEFGLSRSVQLILFIYRCLCLLDLFFCFFLMCFRNRGPTRSGHLWTGVQSVEEQRVWMSQL